MRLSGFALAVAVLAACGSDTGSGGLAGTWVLSEGTVGGEPLALLEGHEITLLVEVDGASAQVSGHSGCNGYFGGWTVGDDGVVEAGPVGSTLMACIEPEGLMEMEAGYLRALGATDHAFVDGGTLVLTGPGTELVFASG